VTAGGCQDARAEPASVGRVSAPIIGHRRRAPDDRRVLVPGSISFSTAKTDRSPTFSRIPMCGLPREARSEHFVFPSVFDSRIAARSDE